MVLEKKAKIIGAAASAIFFALLILFLYLVVLAVSNPRKEVGVEAMVGDSPSSGGEQLFEPVPASDVPDMPEQPSMEQPTEPQNTAVDVPSQNIEQNVNLSTAKKHTEKKIDILELQRQRQAEEDKKKEAAEKAAQEAASQRIHGSVKNVFGKKTPAFGQNGGTGGEDTKGTGQGGKGEMHVNGGAGSGYSWSLAGRSLRGNLVRPDYTVNESGSVVVEIMVDSNGDVIQATVARSTNIDSRVLRNAAIEAAKSTHFNPITSQKHQVGRIIYNFSMQ